MISIKGELASHNYKYKEAAKLTKIPKSTFYRRLQDNKFTIEEAEKILSLVGKKLAIVNS